MSYNSNLLESINPLSTSSYEPAPLEAKLSASQPLTTASDLSDPLVQITSQSSSTVVPPAVVSGTLVSNDPTNPTRANTLRDDYLLVNVNAGQVVKVNLNSTTFDNYLQLINAKTGALIAQNDDFNGGNNAQINFTAQQGINYVLRATSFTANATGSYSLSSTIGTITPGTPLGGSNVFNGTLDSTDPNNSLRSGSLYDGYFLTALPVGKQVRLNMTSTFDNYLQVVNANTGAVIASNDDANSSANAEVNFTVQSGVRYMVRATSFSSNVSGSYSLSTNTGTAITSSQTLSGALSTTDSKNPTRSGSFRDDYLLNSVAAGQQIQVNMNSTFDNYLQLINASTGQVIAFNDDTNGNNAQINFTAQTGVSYLLRATSFAANTTGSYSLSTTSNNPGFTSFNVFDASGDNTSSSVFEGGATRFSYNLANAATLSNVRLEALRGGSVVSTLGTWSGVSLSNQLVNFASFPSLSAGNYQLRAVARTTSGQEFFSTSQAIAVLSWSRSNGTFAGETLNYAAGLGTGAVILGRGGTDTLNLSGISRSNITSINGISLTAFNPLSGSTANQAIFRGTAFDYMTLSDGREIYLQGIENLRFSDASTTNLQVRTNDTFFSSQWNLHTSDVDSAWRFTQGASNVLLASLDSGILTAAGASGGIVDISTARLITDPSDDDNFGDNGHGHQAISVMSSTANNASGVSGINWNSDVLVNDVYGSSRLNLQQAIRDTISYARARNQRVVFQGGIQGEFWLNDGGTQAQLEQLIRDNSDIAMFAVAAGNGAIDIDDTDPNNPSVQQGLSGGVARLQTTHSNVMSVGALEHTGSTVNGLANATSVNRASYSNFGSSLTLMAATDSPAMDKFGNMNFFNGTSAANPNMAAIASLVWSVNSSLTGGQLRQVLIDTAMDLGTAGRDNNFGSGLVNANAAVRRASALQRSSDLANLYSGQSLFV